MSPIGDALNRARQTGTTIGTASDQLASAGTADELAKMASVDSDLSRQIDAQLSGAKATFDGATSTIVPAPEATPDARPDPAPPAPSPRDAGRTLAKRPASTPPPWQAAQPERRSRDAMATGWFSQSRNLARFRLARKRRATQNDWPTTFLRAAPFILIAVVMVLRFGQVMAIAGALIGIGGGLLLLFLMLRLATRTGRKTTHMPKDDQFDRRR